MQHPPLTATLALAALVALGGCGGAGQQHAPRALNVAVAQAQRRTIATFVTLDGQVAPLEESTLSFQQSGPVTAMFVNVGDRVAAGQLLAKIDDSVLRAQLAQDRALIAQASARAQSSQLGVPITRAQTGASAESAKAALENARLTYDQDAQLFAQGYVSKSQFEQARSQYVAAQGAYRTALANEQSTQISSANAQADLASVQSASAQARTLRTEIAQTAMYAPFGGVITARLVDPGAMAGPATPVLRLSKIDTVWINVNVPDEELAFVHAGTPVRFTSSSLGARVFTGRIDAVNAVPTQGTLSYLARIREPNPGDVLRGGMLVSVTIQTARHDGAVVVPRAAVAQTERGTSVYVVHDGKAHLVPVSVGLQTGTLSEVHSPQIVPGTTVITTRPDALQDGSPVTVGGAPAGRRG